MAQTMSHWELIQRMTIFGILKLIKPSFKNIFVSLSFLLSSLSHFIPRSIPFLSFPLIVPPSCLSLSSCLSVTHLKRAPQKWQERSKRQERFLLRGTLRARLRPIGERRVQISRARPVQYVQILPHKRCEMHKLR